MADDVELIALARERILEKFQIDLQREVRDADQTREIGGNRS